MTEPSWLEINLSRLDANLAVVRQIVASQVAVCCVIKANAYGLGAVPVARRLAGLKADLLAVYSPQEAQELARSGVESPVLILMPVRHLELVQELRQLAQKGRLHLTVHDTMQLWQVDRIGRGLGCQIPIHLYLDTGMSRSGLDAAQMSVVLSELKRLRHVCLRGVYTHLATADCNEAFARQQLDQFQRFIREHRPGLDSSVLIHAANTFATLRDGVYHQSMVRVGLGLFGYGPCLLQGQPVTALAASLQPVVRWLSRINHVQCYPKGTSVGYGCTFHLERDSVLGVVPVGYGHGYPLSLGSSGVVNVIAENKQVMMTAPVVGRVSMDQIVVDLTPNAREPTDPPPASGRRRSAAKPQVGSLVELISDDPASCCALPRLAALAGSSCHELLCRLSWRLPRRWLSDDNGLKAQHSGAGIQIKPNKRVGVES